MITEWNEAWWADPPQDNEIGAAWCAATVIRAFIPARIDRPCFFYAKQGDMTFRGDYALLMKDNTPKPQFHVARIFNSLAGEWAAVTGGDGEVSCVAAWDSDRKRLAAVLVNHIDRYNMRRRVRLRFTRSPVRSFRLFRIDSTHCNVYHDRSRAALAAAQEGELPPSGELDVELPPHSVVLVEVTAGP